MSRQPPHRVHFRAILRKVVPASILASPLAPPYAMPSQIAWTVATICQQSHDGLRLLPKEFLQ